MGKISFVRSNKIGINRSEKFSNLFNYTGGANGVATTSAKNSNINLSEIIVPSYFLNPSPSSSLPRRIPILGLSSYPGDIPFNGNIYIKKIIINNIFVKTIGSFFYNITNLEEVVLPPQIESLDQFTFNLCGNLKKITIGHKWQFINPFSYGAYSFIGCTKLENINISPLNPNAIFDSTEKLVLSRDRKIMHVFLPFNSRSSYTIPNYIENLGIHAFAGNSYLQTLVIPNTVKSIGGVCFIGCTNLSSISLSNQITNLPAGVFRACNSLTSITIPASVTQIDRTAFMFSGISSVYLLGNAPTIINGTSFHATSCTFYVCSSATGYGSTYGGRPVVTVTC